jgi:hypothetical protein
MKPAAGKSQALIIIGLAALMHAVAWSMIRETYGWKVNQTPEGSGLLLNAAALLVWIYGFIKYARTKGRSELLGAFLAFFWVPGLVVLLLLPESKPTKSPK